MSSAPTAHLTPAPPAALAPFVHREVTLEAAGRRLALLTSLDLFSSHQVDVGSRLLLRTLEAWTREAAPGPLHVLDLGCGTGPLGIALAVHAGVRAHLVDRDALALDFARENARRNGLADRVTVEASLGVEDLPVEAGYDLVASNVPGKAGARPIAAMLRGALGLLRPGGLLAVVVIEPIRDLVASTLAEPGIEVVLRRDTADYSVFHARAATEAALPPPTAAFAAGDYDRGPLTIEDPRGAPIVVTAVEGLPGGERPGALELAIARRLSELPPAAEALVSHVGQGAIPALLLRARPGLRLTLVDRDLLALRAAQRAVIALGADPAAITALHIGAWPATAPAFAPLVTAVLHEGAGAAAVEAEARALIACVAPGGRALLAGSSTAITRLLARPLGAGLHARRTRHHGSGILEVTRAP